MSPLRISNEGSLQARDVPAGGRQTETERGQRGNGFDVRVVFIEDVSAISLLISYSSRKARGNLVPTRWLGVFGNTFTFP